jgi:hypothetical protein
MRQTLEHVLDDSDHRVGELRHALMESAARKRTR